MLDCRCSMCRLSFLRCVVLLSFRRRVQTMPSAAKSEGISNRAGREGGGGGGGEEEEEEARQRKHAPPLFPPPSTPARCSSTRQRAGMRLFVGLGY